MTIEEAHRIWNALIEGGEGVLDAAVRIARTRALEADEAEALDLIWREFVHSLGRISEILRAIRVEPVASRA